MSKLGTLFQRALSPAALFLERLQRLRKGMQPAGAPAATREGARGPREREVGPRCRCGRGLIDAHSGRKSHWHKAERRSRQAGRELRKLVALRTSRGLRIMARWRFEGIKARRARAGRAPLVSLAQIQKTTEARRH